MKYVKLDSEIPASLLHDKPFDFTKYWSHCITAYDTLHIPFRRLTTPILKVVSY